MRKKFDQLARKLVPLVGTMVAISGMIAAVTQGTALCTCLCFLNILFGAFIYAYSA